MKSEEEVQPAAVHNCTHPACSDMMMIPGAMVDIWCDG